MQLLDYCSACRTVLLSRIDTCGLFLCVSSMHSRLCLGSRLVAGVVTALVWASLRALVFQFLCDCTSSVLYCSAPLLRNGMRLPGNRGQVFLPRPLQGWRTAKRHPTHTMHIPTTHRLRQSGRGTRELRYPTGTQPRASTPATSPQPSTGCREDKLSPQAGVANRRAPA